MEEPYYRKGYAVSKLRDWDWVSTATWVVPLAALVGCVIWIGSESCPPNVSVLMPAERIASRRQTHEYGFVAVDADAAYRGVAREYASDGWRLVDVVSPSNSVYGISSYFDLVFEREIGSEGQERSP